MAELEEKYVSSDKKHKVADSKSNWGKFKIHYFTVDKRDRVRRK